MKKIVTMFFTMFILCVTVLPVFAAEESSDVVMVECEEHMVNFPATPAYTHEVGVDIYYCSNCSHEMWRCSECDKFLSIKECWCEKCGEARMPFNSMEDEKIDQWSIDQKGARIIAVILTICFIALIGLAFFVL